MYILGQYETICQLTFLKFFLIAKKSANIDLAYVYFHFGNLIHLKRYNFEILNMYILGQYKTICQLRFFKFCLIAKKIAFEEIQI